MFADLTFDPLRYAFLKQEHIGQCLPSDLPGLADYLFSNTGFIDYKIKGYINENGSPTIEVKVIGQLDLICQRCLEGLASSIESSTQLVLVKDENLLPDVEDEIEGVDVIVAPTTMSLRQLIEEEVLLALPLTSLHDSEQCHASEEKFEVSKKENPFQVLKDLKRQ